MKLEAYTIVLFSIGGGVAEWDHTSVAVNL